MSTTERPAERYLPEPIWESEPFWTGGKQRELLIYRCGTCGHWFHPPAPACWRCRSRDVGPEPSVGTGVVAAFSVNAHQWLPRFPPPYVVAIVELDDEPGVRLTSNIFGCEPDAVYIGMPVVVDFEDWGDVSIPIFRPQGGS